MPVFLFHGDNALELDDAVRAVRSRFGPESTLLLDGAQVPLPTLAQAAMTAGLFDPERLVVVDRLHERLKGRKDGGEVEEIGSILASIPPTTTLLLVSRDIPADHALTRIAREAKADVQTFITPRRQDLPRWISARARRHEVAIDPDAAGLLADLAGGNALLLDSELEKLALYVGPGGRIDPPVVERLVGAVPQDTIFALVDAIAAGDGARALGLLHDQLESAATNPIDFALYLIRMLARQIRILLRIHLGREAGRNRQEIIAEVKVPRYYAERYFQQAGRLSQTRLIAAFERLAGLEYTLKSSQTDAATGLDLLVADLCA